MENVSGGNQHIKYSSLLVLTVYILFVLYITLFSRSSGLIRTCKLELFWSYISWYKGSALWNEQILFNIALFVPLGFFLYNVLQSWNGNRAGTLSVGFGFLFSVAIETVQYFGRLGTCDVDDVISNVLGTCLGVAVYKVLDHCCSGKGLQWWKAVLSCLFLLAGGVGCRAAYEALPYSVFIPWTEVINYLAPEPEVAGTDLKKIVQNGSLKAYDADHDVYIYQFEGKLYWLIGSPIDKRTEIIFHLHTNEPDKLPEHRKKYKFDNRGFRAGGNNELTRQMRCGKYRAFVREIPAEYNITAVWVGFNTGGKITWSRWFRVKKE